MQHLHPLHALIAASERRADNNKKKPTPVPRRHRVGRILCNYILCFNSFRLFHFFVRTLAAVYVATKAALNVPDCLISEATLHQMGWTHFFSPVLVTGAAAAALFLC